MFLLMPMKLKWVFLKIGYDMSGLYLDGKFEIFVYDLELMSSGVTKLGKELPKAIRNYKMERLLK